MIGIGLREVGARMSRGLRLQGAEIHAARREVRRQLTSAKLREYVASHAVPGAGEGHGPSRTPWKRARALWRRIVSRRVAEALAQGTDPAEARRELGSFKAWLGEGRAAA